MVCSAVTITPGRQNTPLEEKRGRACTATTLRPARSTAPASSCESTANSFAIENLPATTESRRRPSRHIGKTGSKTRRTLGNFPLTIGVRYSELRDAGKLQIRLARTYRFAHSDRQPRADCLGVVGRTL